VIRVSIHAPSVVIRAGLESLLSAHQTLQVIDENREVSRDSEASLDDMAPDVVLVQIESNDGEHAARLADETADGIPVVLLVPDPAEEWGGAFRQGVRAVLSNRATGQQIAAAIEAVAAGLVVVHAGGLESLAGAGILREPREALPEALTAREIEVLRSMAEGLGNKEIASRFGISEHTAKFHVASIMGKLGAANRTEAVMAGIRHGIVLI
jgi:DNA-binding NarL/FixJ family response regulator